MPDEVRVRDSRSIGAGTRPGLVEWACLYPTLRGGVLDRAMIEGTRAEAEASVASFRQRGVEAKLVTRTIPDWTPVRPDL